MGATLRTLCPSGRENPHLSDFKRLSSPFFSTSSRSSPSATPLSVSATQPLQHNWPSTTPPRKEMRSRERHPHARKDWVFEKEVWIGESLLDGE